MLAITFLVLTGADCGWTAAAPQPVSLPAWRCFPALRSGLGWRGWGWPGHSVRGLEKKHPAQVEKKAASPETVASPARFRLEELRVALFWAIGTLVIAGSLFFLSPKGLPAFVASLGLFLRGWCTLSDVQLWRPLLALPAYEILPLVFGVAGAVRGILKRDTVTLRLGDLGAGGAAAGFDLSRQTDRRPGLGAPAPLDAGSH